MATITKTYDFWFRLTEGKCRCGKELKRNQYYCSAKCVNDAMDSCANEQNGKQGE